MAEFTQDEIKAELIKRGVIAAPKPQAMDNDKLEQLKEVLGVDRTPVSAIRDVVGGGLRGAQNLAAVLGEAGQAVGELAAPLRKYVPEKLKIFPEVNIREELGLAGPNQVDIGRMVASKNPNPLLYGAGQFAPAIIAGGPSLAGQALAAGLWGTVQAQPDMNNPGLLQGRFKEGLKDAALTYGGGKVIGGLAKEIAAGFPTVKSFMPSQPAKALLTDLSGTGSLANSQDNATRVARAINEAAEAQKAEALAHKENVYSKTAKTPVDVYPESALPEGNIKQSLKQLGINPADVEPEQAAALQKSIQDYRKHNDFERLQEEVEDIFNVDELKPSQEAKLDELMSIPVSKNLNYLSDKNVSNFDAYNGKLKELHDNFMQNKTFQNAHELESQLNSEIRAKESLSKKGKLDKSGGNDLQALIRSKKALSADMDNILAALPEDLQSEWANFKNKYRENYGAYLNKKRPPLIEIAKGATEGVTPGELREIFSYPDKNVQKVLGDLAPQTKKQILYNELTGLDVNNPKALVEFLDKLEQDQGYAHLLTDDVKAAREEIRRRIRKKDKALNIGSLGTIPLTSKAIKALKLLWNKPK